MLGVNKLLAFLRHSVGLRGDAASATGSLHAKIAEELARIGTINPASGGTDTLFKYLRKLSDDKVNRWTSYAVYDVEGSPQASTILNITGKGYLGVIYSTESTAKAVSIRIDSGTIYVVSLPGMAVLVFPMIRFESSLIIATASTATPRSTKAWVSLD